MDKIPPALAGEIDDKIRHALMLAPETPLNGVSADYLEAHWLAVLEAIWLIEAAHGVYVPLNDNLPAQNIHNASDLMALCVETVIAGAA